LHDHGYWIGSQPNYVGRKTHPQTFSELGVGGEIDFFLDKQFCAGGLQGYVRGSFAYENILLRAVQCALDEDCIAPVGAGRENHNYDQSVVSILAYNLGLPCNLDRNYNEMDLSRLTLNEMFRNDVVLGLRRWHIPKPYIGHLQSKSECTPTLPWRPKEFLVVENMQGHHLQSENPLLTCLRTSTERSTCRHLIQQHKHSGSTNKYLLYESYRDHFLVYFFKGLRCLVTYVFFSIAMFAYCFYRHRERQQPARESPSPTADRDI
jgi:hypothetical protein